jgi:hypothetical protein
MEDGSGRLVTGPARQSWICPIHVPFNSGHAYAVSLHLKGG